MTSFGEDVRAVIEALDLGEVVLVGHSMGGAVVLEAAQQLAGRILGILGVDTLVYDSTYSATTPGTDR
jgi:pimeloyl-ACP methyl ester carboxylesterase